MAKSKKQNREGTIYFDEKSGSWRGEISWVDRNGELRRKSFKSKKQIVVKAKLNDFKKQLLLDEAKCDPEKTTFEEYATYWLTHRLKPKLKPGSYERKERTLKQQVFPHIRDVPISDLSSRDIEKMLTALKDEGLSYSTIKKAYEAVNGCFKAFRIDRQSNLFNPCEGVSIPTENKKEVSEILFFNKEQREKIEAEATKTYSNGTPVYRFGQAIVLIMYSGLRIGELLALCWSDVDFENKAIHINKNAVMVKQDGKYQIINQKSTKTKSGVRVIPMTQKAMSALKKLQELTGEEKWVITSQNHQQVQQNNINRIFHKIISKANILAQDETPDHFGVHTLRHTFASMLFANGCSSKVVSEILGHADTKITENIYIHLIQEQKVKAIQNIDQYSD